MATLLEWITALADRWSTSFGEELSTPGSPTSRFTTVQEALNAVSDALFYLDKMTKDAKLGTPLGLINCESETCPEVVEFHSVSNRLGGSGKTRMTPAGVDGWQRTGNGRANRLG